MKSELGDWHSTKIPSCYFLASMQKHNVEFFLSALIFIIFNIYLLKLSYLNMLNSFNTASNHVTVLSEQSYQLNKKLENVNS